MRRHIAHHDVRIDTRDADIAVGVDPLHLMPDGAAGLVEQRQNQNVGRKPGG